MKFDDKFITQLLHQDFGALDMQCALEPMSDSGNANRLISRFGEDLIFVEDGGWVWWDGLRWNESDGEYGADLSTHLVLNEMEKVELSILREGPDAEQQRAKQFERWAQKSGNIRHLRAMLARAKPKLTKSVNIFDTDPGLLSCKNGTIELGPKHVFRWAYRSDLITKQLGVRYVEGARCPKFEKFLVDCLPDPEMRKFLQRVSGFCLTGARASVNVFLLVGHDYSGRSVFARVLREICGEYAANVPDNFFAKRGRRAVLPPTTNRRGKRLLATGEALLGGSISGRLLAYADAPTLIERNYGKKPFVYSPAFKLILPADFVPNVNSEFAQNVLTIPFQGSNLEFRAQHDLLEILMSESEGILLWALNGCEQWFAMGLNAPPSAHWS